MRLSMGRAFALTAVVGLTISPLMAEELQLKERTAAPQQAAKGKTNLLSTGCSYRPPPGTRYVELDSRGCPIAPADAGVGTAPSYPASINPQITPQTILPQGTAPTGTAAAPGYYPYPYPVNPPEGLPPDWTPLPEQNTTTTITKNPDGSSTTTTTPVAPSGWSPAPPAGWQSMPAPVNRWYGSGGTGTETGSGAASTGTAASGAATAPSADSGTGVLPPYPPYPPYPVNPPQGLPPGWTPLPQQNTSTTITKGPDGSSTTTTTPVAPPGWAPPPPAGWQSMPAPVNRWYGAKKATP